MVLHSLAHMNTEWYSCHQTSWLPLQNMQSAGHALSLSLAMLLHHTAAAAVFEPFNSSLTTMIVIRFIISSSIIFIDLKKQSAFN